MKTSKYIIIAFIIAFAGITANVNGQSLASDTVEVTELSKYDKAGYFDKLEKSLLYGLSSDVNGVVDSALFNAVSYKIVYPEFNSDRLLRKVSSIALNGDSHLIRFKAYLTLTYYQNQNDFDAPVGLIGYVDSQDQNRLFFYLQNEVQEDRVTVMN